MPAIANVSFEFFPPHTQRGIENLTRAATTLQTFDPGYFSVTYGAGGSTRDRTIETVWHLRGKGFNAIPHLSWGNEDLSHVRSLLAQFADAGIDKLVVLRGDRPTAAGAPVTQHFASELVDLIRRETGDCFQIHVAGYPEMHPDAPHPSGDLDYLKQKIAAGADTCITQYFFNADAYEHFVNECRRTGISCPIVPGIMPIRNHDQLTRFSDKCGAEIPRWIRTRLVEYREDIPSLIAFGVDVVTALVERLIQLEAPGFHFYTLNKAVPTTTILSRLRNC